MLSRPTTDEAITGVLRDLEEVVLPAVNDEAARVALQMIQQVLRSAAVRAAHEIAWMHDEIADIRAAAEPLRAVATVDAALIALDDLDTDRLHLADVRERYGRAGEVLSCAIDAAFATGDRDAVGLLRAVLTRRSANEMRVVGQLDLVGRG